MMTQVAKEHLGYLSKNPPTMIKPNSTSLSDPTYLHSLLQKVLTCNTLDLTCINDVDSSLLREKSSSSLLLARKWQLLVF